MATTATTRQLPRIVRDMTRTELPPELDPLLDQYAAVTEDRDELLWQWLYYVFPSFRLSSVADEYAETARKAKFCFSLFMTVLDDLSERHRDKETFEQGRKIPFSSTRCETDAPDVDTAALSLLQASWDRTEAYLDHAPRREDFRELFEFDLRQSLNTMDYNRLVNDGPQLASPHGADMYDTHNMLLYIYVDIDLAFSPDFDRADLATLRDVTWDAQRLARIGNWVTTWERELDECDYTSRVVIEALGRGIVTEEEIRSPDVANDELARRIKAAGIEREHLLTWNETYRKLVSREYDVDSVDLHSFVDGMRHLLEVDVKARGLK
ncbi:hypothetical protein [Salinigranum salinum]|uniref:hypothetical protein n=1 Tax=Salinigranum salinum TaxID=1364937 RepID=UPI001260F114|nr:hypothetical protein [Salinigranum salinum]